MPEIVSGCQRLPLVFYYVSADGREIIDNFTRSNSIIPSNEVHSIVCEPNSSDVYFGTTNGVAVYHSTITPAASDFSDVYAYPNPVRPDYTGWITIKGLMDNSLVKIADSAGNVFLQTRSEGRYGDVGRMQWSWRTCTHRSILCVCLSESGV